MMEIIKCKCGYYKQLNDELCPNCGADYSLGDEYEVLSDQESAYMRWLNLGEKGFNNYMQESQKPQQPLYMICQKCKFKMLITETRCPRCNMKVKYVPREKAMFSFPERFMFGFSHAVVWLNFLIIIGVIIFVLFILALTIF